MNRAESLLDPEFLRRLERLEVSSKRPMRGSHAGKRRSRSLGSSLEFADYRMYSPGDDLRQLDWNAYARSGKLFVKRFLDEQELHITLYLDCSKSMTFGQPSKWEKALQLAAALGYVSLCHLDYVSVFAFDDAVCASLGAVQGKGKAKQLFQFLSALETGGTGSVNKALHSGRAVHGKPGIAIVLSDFLSHDGYEQGIAFLQAARQEVVLVHLFAREEAEPPYQGDLRLIDSETKEAKEIAFTPALLAEYERAVQGYRESLAQFAFRRGMRYFQVEAEATMEQTVFHIFRKSGLIR